MLVRPFGPRSLRFRFVKLIGNLLEFLVAALLACLVCSLKIAVDSEHSLPPLCWHQESINSAFDFAAGIHPRSISLQLPLALLPNNFTLPSSQTAINPLGKIPGEKKIYEKECCICSPYFELACHNFPVKVVLNVNACWGLSVVGISIFFLITPQPTNWCPIGHGSGPGNMQHHQPRKAPKSSTIKSWITTMRKKKLGDPIF